MTPRKSKPEITSEVVVVSPDQALEWLELNKLNRNINRHHVMSLAGAMERDEWHLNGQSISFNTDGTLQDGQHRLMAVVKSQKTVPMLVVRNVDPAARPTVDVGRKRTVADELTMSGELNGTILGAILMMSRRIDQGVGRGASVVLSSIQALDMVKSDDDYRLSAGLARHLDSHVVGAPESVIGYTTYKFLKRTESNVDEIKRFWEPFESGKFDGPTDPRFVLQKSLGKLAADRGFSSGQFSNKVFLAALIVRAWNAWRQKKEVHVLRWDRSTAFPKVV